METASEMRMEILDVASSPLPETEPAESPVRRTAPALHAAAGAELAEFRRLVPPALLDGPGWDRVLACVAELPDAGPPATHLGYEFRLGEDTPAADLSLAVSPGTPLGRHFIRRGEAAHPGSEAAALARHLVSLEQADSPLRRCIAGTMLEYDLAETAAGPLPEPGVFLRIRVSAEYLSHDRRHSPLAALADAVGWPDDGELRRSVARALAALPPGGKVRQIGALPGRALRAVRLVIQEIGHDGVAGVLERWGRRGSVGPVMEVLTDLEEVLPRFRLSVDVAAAGLLPRIGLELYHAGSWSDEMDTWLTTGRSDWRPVVERLESRGWCLPAKARGLLQWCALERMYGRRRMFIVYKGINHVKLMVTGAEVAAKAYAGMACSLVQAPQPGSGC